MISKRRSSRKFVAGLREVPLFADCTEAELRLVASMSTPIDVDPGRVLMQEGELGYECFIVLCGQAVVERDHQIVGHAVNGSIVGELSILDPQSRRNATVTAATPMTLLVMTRSEFAAIRNLGVDSVRVGLERAAAAHATAPAPRTAAVERRAGAVAVAS